MTTKQRSLRAFAVGVAIGLAAVACTSETQGEPNAATSAQESPADESPADESPTTEGQVLAEQMRLVGSLPGSDGNSPSGATWRS